MSMSLNGVPSSLYAKIWVASASALNYCFAASWVVILISHFTLMFSLVGWCYASVTLRLTCCNSAITSNLASVSIAMVACDLVAYTDSLEFADTTYTVIFFSILEAHFKLVNDLILSSSLDIVAIIGRYENFVKLFYQLF